MPHRDVFAGASSTQLQPARATNYAYARRAAPCGRPTRGLHAREARLHAGFGDRDVRVRHCRGPHQNQELINSADSRMLDRSSPYLTHQRIECKTRTQGPYSSILWIEALSGSDLTRSFLSILLLSIYSAQIPKCVTGFSIQDGAILSISFSSDCKSLLTN